jgi:two-component system cell cycle response regulator
MEQQRFELILMDAALPEGVGLELLGYLYENRIDIPVVVLAGDGDEMTASRLINAGAYDLLPKNRMIEGVFGRVIANVQEKLRLQHEVKEARRQISRQAITDDRTGLFNRRYFMEILEREVSLAKRYGSGLVVGLVEPVMSLGVDTDQMPTYKGALLAMVGRLLSRKFRKSDIVCRFGGGTIGVILPQAKLVPLAARLESLRRKIGNQEFEYMGKPLNVPIHIGIVAFNSSEIVSPEDLVERARAALMKARNRGEVYADGTG